MKEFTVEQLVNAIRQADDLQELKHMVGPSDADNKKSADRIAAIDKIYDQYGGDLDSMPYHVREKNKQLNEEQDLFESEYC